MAKKSFTRFLAFCFISLVLIAAQPANAGEITLRSMESEALAANYPYTIYFPDFEIFCFTGIHISKSYTI